MAQIWVNLQTDHMSSRFGHVELSTGMLMSALFLGFALTELALPRRGQASSDARRIAINFTLTIVGGLLAALLPFGTTIAAMLAERWSFGLFQHIEAPALVVLGIGLLARTLVNYGFHRAAHRWTWLWRIHRVHHSDTQVDVSLALRHHPFEGLVALPLYGAVGLILGLPPWSALTIDLIFFAFNCWEHLDIRTPAGLRRLTLGVMTTPDWHRVHHSAERSQTDSNFGTVITLWDHVFATASPAERPVARIGLGDVEDRLARSWSAQLASPFQRREDSVPMP